MGSLSTTAAVFAVFGSAALWPSVALAETALDNGAETGPDATVYDDYSPPEDPYYEPDPYDTSDPYFESDPYDIGDPYFDPEEFGDSMPPVSLPAGRAGYGTTSLRRLSIAGSEGVWQDELGSPGFPMPTALDDATISLALVIDSLQELGGFTSDEDPIVNALLENFASSILPIGPASEAYRRELTFFANDWPVLLQVLTDDGALLAEELYLVQEDIESASFEVLISGGEASLDPIPWIESFADLLVRGGSAAPGRLDTGPADLAAIESYLSVLSVPQDLDSLALQIDEPGAATPDVDSLAEVAPGESLSDTSTDEGASSGLPMSGGIAIALTTVTIGAVIALRNGRDKSPAAAAPAAPTNELLDASRRMTASLNAIEISRIALAEAARMVGSDGGILVTQDDGQLRSTHAEPQHLFSLSQVENSGLARVIDTGQATYSVSETEALLAELPMAVASVPIVSAGNIAGALMVTRSANKPFSQADIAALEMLAPLVGSALHAASTHGSATRLADVEPLTGLKNRRCLDRDLTDFALESTLSYIMLDVDHFKNFNDINGHAAGDEALKTVADTLSAVVRPSDVVYRYGGEEFCVLLPGANAEEAVEIADRARQAIEASSIPGSENQPGGRLTVSIGVADTDGGPAKNVAERADAALYEAKHNGRNQVRFDGQTVSG